jgi:hypothetical protein
MTLYMLGKHCTSELHPGRACIMFFIIFIYFLIYFNNIYYHYQLFFKVTVFLLRENIFQMLYCERVIYILIK